MNNDPWIPRMVIANVALLGLTAMVGSILMPQPPTWFQSMALASLTGLMGYLAPSPIRPVPLTSLPPNVR